MMNQVHMNSTILWRHARWRCESSCEGAFWTGRLWLDDVVVSECAVDDAHELFCIARKWLKVIVEDSSSNPLEKQAARS